MTGRTAVVTGASGFIGAQLVAALAASGTRVTAIDRRPAPAVAPGAEPVRDDVERRVLELTDPTRRDELARVVGDADVVFHLAGLPGVRDTRPGVDAARQRDNVVAAEVLLAVTPLDVPLVVTSSSSVYGGARRDRDGRARPSREADVPAPRGGYARSKVVLERVCAARATAGGAITVVRPFTVAGEGQRGDMAIARWLDATARGDDVVVLGSLDRTRDITDVRDVVRGIVAAADFAHDPRADVVNLGAGTPWTLREMVVAVERAVERPCRLRIVPASDDEPDATVAHTDRCAQVLGFVPTTDLDALVARQWAASGAVSLTNAR